jgi:flagellar hook-length control protein FliK
MTPSIAPAQSSRQVVSPTQGVPARDGDPSPFEAYLGTLRKSLTLSAFTLAPPAPSIPVQPAPEAKEPAPSTESRPKQDPSAQEPAAKATDDAESARPEAEPAPEEAPKRKDSAEPEASAPAQPHTNPLCTPAPRPDPGKADETTPQPPKAEAASAQQPKTVDVIRLAVPTALPSEPAKAIAPRPEPTGAAPHQTQTTDLPPAGTKPAEPHAGPLAPNQPAQTTDAPVAAADAPSDDHAGEIAQPEADGAVPTATPQKTSIRFEVPVLSMTVEPHASFTAEPHAAPTTSPAPQQTTAPLTAPDAGIRTESPDATPPAPAEHKVQPAHAQPAPKPQAPADPPPPPPEVHVSDKPVQPVPQARPDADPPSAPRTTSQPHQSSTAAPTAQPANAQTTDAAAQAPQQAPARAISAPSAGDRAAARPITAIAGASTPISSKEALGKLSGQAPVLRRAVEQQSIILQTARGLAAALKNGDGTVTLSLQPPRLGQLKVHLTMADGLIQARMEPTTQAARQLLIDSEHSLRAALEARGLSVERIQVDAVKPPHANDAAPRHDSHSAADHGRPDTPGGDNAGPGHRGGHAGSGAEAHAGSHERAEAPDSEPALGSAAVTYALEGGGTYRLRLDALA